MVWVALDAQRPGVIDGAAAAFAWRQHGQCIVPAYALAMKQHPAMLVHPVMWCAGSYAVGVCCSCGRWRWAFGWGALVVVSQRWHLRTTTWVSVDLWEHFSQNRKDTHLVSLEATVLEAWSCHSTGLPCECL